MSNLCEITQPHYLRALLQLLPTGYAWEWDDNSAGRRVLAVFASELHRVHELLCGIGRYNVERFAVGVTGWSAPDYERLLLSKFGITATVTDNEFKHAECGAGVGASLYSNRYSYIFTITVDDLSVITPTVIDYLQRYKQSHTALHIRELRLHWTTDYDITALTVGNAVCGSALYAHDYHSITLDCDPTLYNPTDIQRLVGYQDVRDALRDYTHTLCDVDALTAGGGSVGDSLFAEDWHITERVLTRLNYTHNPAVIYG